MGFPIDPKRMALLNVDLQNCFVENSPIAAPGGREVLGEVNRLTVACRDAGIQIIHTRHVVKADGSDAGVLADLIPPVAEGIINEGSESSQLHPELDVQDGDITLKKPRFGAFYAHFGEISRNFTFFPEIRP